MIRLMANMKNTQKRKMRRNFLSVFDVYLTNFTNEVACKLKKNQPNLALKSDTATQACASNA